MEIINEKIIYKEDGFAIQGAIFEVYRHLGCGFLESVYQEALERELLSRNIPYRSQQELVVYYKGDPLQQTFRADLVCYGKILLELKAVNEITYEHKAQVMNYLKVTGLRLGLLVNFGNKVRATVDRIAM
jgi:GxxExxY protein